MHRYEFVFFADGDLSGDYRVGFKLKRGGEWGGRGVRNPRESWRGEGEGKKGRRGIYSWVSSGLTSITCAMDIQKGDAEKSRLTLLGREDE